MASLPASDRAALANPLVAGMTGPMLAWLARHEPRTVERAAAVLLPKDALRATLVPVGTVTDRSDASATLLWDVTTDDWSAAAVAAAGVDPRLLPAVRPATEVVGTAALPVGEVPVVVGGADTPLALLAAGTAGRPGQPRDRRAAAAVRLGAPARRVDPVVHGYADVSGGWYAMAGLQNGGSAWEWVVRRARDVLGRPVRRGRRHAGRRRGSGLPAVPHRRAGRRRAPVGPGRVERPAPGDDARGPGAGGGRGRGVLDRRGVRPARRPRR